MVLSNLSCTLFISCTSNSFLSHGVRNRCNSAAYVVCRHCSSCRLTNCLLSWRSAAAASSSSSAADDGGLQQRLQLWVQLPGGSSQQQQVSVSASSVCDLDQLSSQPWTRFRSGDSEMLDLDGECHDQHAVMFVTQRSRYVVFIVKMRALGAIALLLLYAMQAWMMSFFYHHCRHAPAAVIDLITEL